ncbi:hypothetical protein CPB83DRAFT_858397 [Crepidotus variabilis]|uniref:VLRF1 domain-containing protein n=1 Tax=Crepidotus variabilis TaxID=179855 RepID=A0A9P6EC82_9AGAR|nr:hypothetical protein CPB83DRAFT_858397 [Crepidotus variabilis]
MQTSQHHVFSLPQELLETLTPRNLVNKEPPRASSPEPVVSATNSGPRACNICQGVIFLNVDEQRTHFRSDWHRYNVKTRLAGRQTVNEASFSQLVEGLEDSLSGSASSEDDDEDSDAVNSLVNKAKQLITRSPSPDSSSKNPPVTALTWFHSPPSTQIGIYRALLPLKTDPTHYLDELRNLQRPVTTGRKWAMFMVAGGHFAGAVVRVSPAVEDEEDEVQSGRKKKQKKPKPDAEVFLHKTFHRYTTRRKQGGSQSANDNAKGPAKSAGALLRRYGEQALRDDIRGLLLEWAEEIADCDRIWVRASTSNRRIFYNYEGAHWTKEDPRLRGFPFPTRRPTQSELSRCLLELTRPKISHFTEQELLAQDEAYLASLPKARPILPSASHPMEKEKLPKAPKLSKDEEAIREKWSRLLEMVSKNRVEALKAFLEREGPSLGGPDAPIPEWTNERKGTILQVAVSAGNEEITCWLLEEGNADPTIAVPLSKTQGEGEHVRELSEDDEGPSKVSRRTAYDLAKTKALRDIFRRVAAAQPDRWDWFGAGHVPSALTQEMEVEQEEKKKVKRKGLRDRVKEREAREKEKEKDRPKTPEISATTKVTTSAASNSNRLGGAAGVTEGISGLTPEMRAKVERERRARAAEARLNTLGRA